MADSLTDLWSKRKETQVAELESGIRWLVDEARSVESDRLIADRQKSDVTSLRKQLEELAEQAASLRKSFRPGGPEIVESTNDGLAEEVARERTKANGEPAEVEA